MKAHLDPTPAPVLDLPPLSHAEAREVMALELMRQGKPREEAEAIALRTSVRVVRKEGYKL